MKGLVVFFKIFLLILVFPDISISLDESLFQKATVKVCNANSDCTQFPKDDIHLGSGQVLSFTDFNEDKIEVTLKNTGYPIYETSDFFIKTSSISHCTAAGICEPGRCHLDDRHPDFKHENNNTIYGFGCKMDLLHSGSCWHKSACVFYKYVLKEKDARATVYIATQKIWYANIEIKWNNQSVVYKFNHFNRSYNIQDPKLKFTEDIPINVKGFNSEHLNTLEYGLLDYNKFYQVNANPLNFPNKALIGDLQIALKNNGGKEYETTNIICSASGNQISCQHPFPTLRRFRKMHSKRHIDTVQKLSNTSLVANIEINARVSLMLENIHIKNLNVKPGNCRLKVNYTYACLGCSQKPYALISSYNLKVPGIIHYESNCSFTSPYFSCSENSYKVEYLLFQPYCLIYIPSRNQKTYVKAVKEFSGRIEFYHPETSFTNEGLLHNVLNSKSLLDNILKSVGSYIILVGLIALISVIFKVMYINRLSFKNRSVNRFQVSY